MGCFAYQPGKGCGRSGGMFWLNVAAVGVVKRGIVQFGADGGAVSLWKPDALGNTLSAHLIGSSCRMEEEEKDK